MTLHMAAGDALIQERVGSWYPAIDRARKARFRELVAQQREPHDGYDVYPACDHKTAVVRMTGQPAQWETSLETPGTGRAHRYRPGFAIPSMHATGFGGGCVRPWAYHVMFSNAAELPSAVEHVGRWLVENDVAGEVDLVISAMPVLQ